MSKRNRHHFISRYDIKNFGKNFNVYKINNELLYKTPRSANTIFYIPKGFSLIEKDEKMKENSIEEFLSKVEDDLCHNTNILVNYFDNLVDDKFCMEHHLNEIKWLFQIITKKTKPGLLDYRQFNLNNYIALRNFEQKLKKITANEEHKISINPKYENNFSLDLASILTILLKMKKNNDFPDAHINEIFNESKVYILKTESKNFIFNDFRFAKLNLENKFSVIIFPITKKYCVLTLPLDLFSNYDKNIINADEEFVNFINNCLSHFSFEQYAVNVEDKKNLSSIFNISYKKLNKYNQKEKTNQIIHLDRNLLMDSNIVCKFFISKIRYENFIFTHDFGVIKKNVVRALEEIKKIAQNSKIRSSETDDLQKEFLNLFHKNKLNLFDIHYFSEKIKKSIIKCNERFQNYK